MKELDSMMLVGPFQLSVFCDSANLLWFFWGHLALGRAPGAGQTPWVFPGAYEHLAVAWDGSLGLGNGTPHPQTPLLWLFTQAGLWHSLPVLVSSPSTVPKLMVPLTCLGKAALLHCNDNTHR